MTKEYEIKIFGRKLLVMRINDEEDIVDVYSYDEKKCQGGEGWLRSRSVNKGEE